MPRLAEWRNPESGGFWHLRRKYCMYKLEAACCNSSHTEPCHGEPSGASCGMALTKADASACVQREKQLQCMPRALENEKSL